MSEALHSFCLSLVGVQLGEMKKYVKMPFWKFCWNPVGIVGEVISTE